MVKYTAENEMRTLSAVGNHTDLAARDELYAPLLYYGSTQNNRRCINIEYVSDIHLLHHAQYYADDTRKTVKVLTKSLWRSYVELSGRRTTPPPEAGLSERPIFLGDVSSDKDVTIAFYKQFRLRSIYSEYKRYKAELAETKSVSELRRERANARRRNDNLAKYITVKEAEFKQLKSSINKYVNYGRTISPKGDFEHIKAYLESDYYKKRNLPHHVEKEILNAATLKDNIEKLKRIKHRFELIAFGTISSSDYAAPRDLRDFKYDIDRLGPIGLVILGNHEYVGFSDVDKAIEFYKNELEPLGYIVLQNEYAEDSRCVIYGGSGFAKYSENFNANNLICCEKMIGNRTYEIEQTTLFENGYEAARKHAKEAGKCFICATHYPLESCLGKFDKDAVYFTGHTHQNKLVKTEDLVLYADNQIGYHKHGGFDGAIRFKRATTGSIRNPYSDLEDGCHPTSTEEYLQFCGCIGEYIGEGRLIRKRCETGKLYVIKSQGYYGFFIVNDKGTSIVNGGRTKQIALSGNIEWIRENFDIVVAKYLAALEPLRMRQEEISRELKRLGFWGFIHGLIVDVNYDHHIMVNPVDGSLAFYWSPIIGSMCQLGSFRELIESVKSTAELMSPTSYKSLTAKCDAILKDHNRNALMPGSRNALLSTENDTAFDRLTQVDLKTGVYKVSRNIAPLQRLFTGHVLRDFDLRLVENESDSPALRKRSLRGRVCRDGQLQLYLVVKDDLNDFVTLLDAYGKESTISFLDLKKMIRKEGAWMTRCFEETFATYSHLARYGSKHAPEAWRSAIKQMQSKELKEGE